MNVEGMLDQEQPETERRKRMSCALEIDCPGSIKDCLKQASNDGYHFVVTHIIHPRFARDLHSNVPQTSTRTDRVLASSDWNRLVVGKVTPGIQLDSEIDHIRRESRQLMLQELGFMTHLGLPAIMISLVRRNNTNLARLLMDKFVGGVIYQVWINLPMVHPSQYSPICEEDDREDMWEWWNDLRRYCHYDKRLGLALELSEVKHVSLILDEMDRWVGEPVKALIISTSLFLTNQHKQPVLAKVHQDIIQKFLNLDVQFIIKGAITHGGSYKPYQSYINFLGKKLYSDDVVSEFVHGCEDYLQSPLQPLTEHLETLVYEIFEKDQIKYVEYQNAIQKALEDVPCSVELPVIMIVGAGRGPLVQATLNASYILQRKIKVYAVEKNPYAINTLMDRVQNEWNNQVILINEDMRKYEPPEQADILVSELLGSFGDNELSPECLDGAQRFLKKTGVSIPSSYTSFLAPLQSTKIFNEIRSNRPHDKTLECCYETPYVVHVVNYYQIAPTQELFKFEHPNWSKVIDNERYKKLRFHCSQNCVLTGFSGYFETVLYKDVMLSINPPTYSKGMVSWFPICFPLQEPVQVTKGSVIEVSFWRAESDEKVWYQWCLESPVKGSIANPNGRSYFIKKF